MARPEVITADLAIADAVVSGQSVKVAVPVLIHREAGLVWQSDRVFPLWDSELGPAGQELERLRQAAVLHWPEVAGATDWWYWAFPEETT